MLRRVRSSMQSVRMKQLREMVCYSKKPRNSGNRNSKRERKRQSLTIQNVTMNAYIVCKRDVVDMVVELFAAQFEGKHFKSAYIHIAFPQVVLIVARNGSVIVTGMHHPCDAILALQLVAWRIYHAYHIKIQIRDLKLSTISTSGSLGVPLNLEAFYRVHGDVCKWVKETFPGLSFPVDKEDVIRKYHHITFLLFASGSVVAVGVKSITKAREIFDEFADLLIQHYSVAATTTTVAAPSAIK